MSLDLILLPFDHPGGSAARAVLPLIEHRAFFEELRMLPVTPVPPDFDCYLAGSADEEYTIYGRCVEDAQGDPLGYLTAAVLCRYADHPGARNGSANRAAWAYLAALPPQTPVALYWC